MSYRGRLAPTPSGEAHLGTLLSALIAWCDARCAGGRLVLRLDDLDASRCRPEFSRHMAQALAWLGLDWDAELAQSTRSVAHAHALDQLAGMGRLYSCACPRRQLRRPERAVEIATGAHRCRQRPLAADAWRDARAPLRARLDVREQTIPGRPGPADGSPPPAPCDPIVRRADGTVAYLMASVVDDGALGTTDAIRGADLAPLAATQTALAEVLGLSAPHYRHHFLLRRADGHKLAKRRGDTSAMRAAGATGAAAVCGQLAFWAGLVDHPAPLSPAQILPSYAWSRVRASDLTLASTT